MVCLAEETKQAIITDTIATGPKRQSSINLTPSKSVDIVFNEVALDFHYPEDSFELCIQNETGDIIVLNQYRGRTLGDIGVKFDENNHHKLIISSLKVQGSSRCSTKDACLNSNDASLNSQDASLNSKDASVNSKDLRRRDFVYLDFYLTKSNKIKAYGSCEMDVKVTESYNYVGLVNQAMTCYLNSLLQALYMTPEFRNALYNWEFDGVNETRSIPFQLQKLFLNLQTSTKSAVETTDLTTSFGWQGSEAWQQHDIQELCRVMFDALEQKFKCTKQANLINDLYEGKMLDYVKCLECSTEKSREDTFLDIPLPVRPFGSAVAYNSVEEALRAFVQPETLDGNNQYHCEKCNKKCDAHKGLKFTKFPYLLTLHLKRFDFDYNTMHRIKLNDKVVFPQILNLNSFIFPSASSNDHEVMEERETMVKCDDSSTTSDSGSALDDESCQGAENLPTLNGQDDACHDEDEGIDMSEVKGPYIYELFSIMIHSGSASGGHYYAYIKDFQRNQWFCFNDMNVSRITEEDIKKTYGGGPQRGYYSSAYSSSTNAYMLMYRQIEKERNCNAMSVEDFPPHIQKLLQQMKEKEECDRISKEKENDLIKLKVYCELPVQNQMMYTKLAVYIDSTLEEAVKDAFSRFKLVGLVPLEDCRLVSYNKVQDYIDCSFERDDLRFCDITNRINIHQNDWLLEIKQPGTQFQTYKPGGVNMKVFVINLETEEVDGPTNVRVNAGETVSEFKAHLAHVLNMDVNTMKVVKETYSNEPQLLEDDDMPMKFDPSFSGYKIYVSNAIDEDPEKQFLFSKLHRVIDRFVHIISINIVLPDTNLSTLESLSIPPLDLNQNLDKNELVAGGDRLNNSPNLRVSPQPGVLCGEGFGDQSNSEDSSLSDSDRTLVGDAPGDCLGLLSSSSNSPADQHMASPSDPAEDTYNHEVFGNPAEEMNWENEPEPLQRCANYYFRATTCVPSTDFYADAEVARYCKVLVDKRMTLCKFKKHLEPIVGVPVDYFKIYRQYPNQDDEWSRLKDTLGTAKDGERLIVKLGRVLKKDEYSGKIYHFTPNGTETFSLLFENIIAKGQTVGAVKREIIFQAKKQHMLDIPFYRSRLRKKSWKNPSKIYLDDQKFVEDVNLNNNFELFIQQLEQVEKLTSPKQLVLFVRHWSPSTLTLSPFSEIILDTPTMDELKKRISEKSDIPQEFVEVVCLKSSFPCDVNVLEIHGDLDWNPNVTLLENWPLQIYEDGSVFFYRDSREQLKELSQEEKKELNQKENTRLGRYSSKTYSPGRERALKIYLDTSPSKPKDNCVD